MSPFSNTSRRILRSVSASRRVAFEPLARPRRVLQDLADHLARLRPARTRCRSPRRRAPAAGSRRRTAPPWSGKRMRDPPRQAADRALLVLEVEQRHVAFGGGVELDDLRNLEAALERPPDLGPQPVAAGEPQPVRALLRMRRRVEQVAAELADILEQRAVPAHDVVPELARGEICRGSPPSRPGSAPRRSPARRRRCDTSAGSRTSGRSPWCP